MIDRYIALVLDWRYQLAAGVANILNAALNPESLSALCWPVGVCCLGLSAFLILRTR